MAESKLTEKQRRFVEEYLIDSCAAKAAIRAGYSKRKAPQTASRLLHKEHVQAAIHAAKKRQSERVEVTQDWIISNLVEIVQRAKTDIPVLDKKGNPTGEYKFDGAVANRAIELLGKHLDMFTDQTIVTSKVTGAFEDFAKVLRGALGDETYQKILDVYRKHKSSQAEAN